MRFLNLMETKWKSLFVSLCEAENLQLNLAKRMHTALIVIAICAAMCIAIYYVRLVAFENAQQHFQANFVINTKIEISREMSNISGHPSTVFELQEFNSYVHSRMREELKKYNNASMISDYLAPFIPSKQVFLYIPKYNLATCQVGKCLSTRQFGIFCYLFDSKRFSEAGHTIEKADRHTRFCRHINLVHNVAQMSSKIVQYDTLYVVRDPLARFVSAYVDKCIHEHKKIDSHVCFRCNRDIDCVLKNIIEEAMEFVTLKKNRDVDLLSYAFRHFAPQNWYCDMYKHYKTFFFIKYEEGSTIAKRFGEALRLYHVPEFEIDKVQESLQENKRTAHATVGNPETIEIRNKLIANKTLLSQFLWIYEMDYRIFGFPKPTI